MGRSGAVDARFLAGLGALLGAPLLGAHLLAMAAAAPAAMLMPGVPTPVQQRIDQAPAGPYRMGWEPAPMLVGPPES